MSGLGKIILAVSVWLSSGLIYATMLKGPYLLYPGKNTEMTVLWQLDSTQLCMIEWGRSTSYEADFTDTVERNSLDTDVVHLHMWTLTDLDPGTKYYYKVTCGDDYVEHKGTFVTAPLIESDDVKFLVYGDTRSYFTIHNKVAKQILDEITEDPDYQSLLLHAGDWVNSGDMEADWQDQFFNRTQSSLLSLQAKIPINGIRGNHEMGGIQHCCKTYRCG